MVGIGYGMGTVLVRPSLMVMVVIVSDPASVLSMGRVVVVFDSGAGVTRDDPAEIQCQQRHSTISMNAH